MPRRIRDDPCEPITARIRKSTIDAIQKVNPGGSPSEFIRLAVEHALQCPRMREEMGGVMDEVEEAGLRLRYAFAFEFMNDMRAAGSQLQSAMETLKLSDWWSRLSESDRVKLQNALAKEWSV